MFRTPRPLIDAEFHIGSGVIVIAEGAVITELGDAIDNDTDGSSAQMPARELQIEMKAVGIAGTGIGKLA